MLNNTLKTFQLVKSMQVVFSGNNESGNFVVQVEDNDFNNNILNTLGFTEEQIEKVSHGHVIETFELVSSLKDNGELNIFEYNDGWHLTDIQVLKLANEECRETTIGCVGKSCIFYKYCLDEAITRSSIDGCRETLEN